MDKKDFIFPGVIVAIVAIVLVGLLIQYSHRALDAGTVSMATSTSATTTGPAPVVGTHLIAPTSAYYPYGTITLSLNQVAGFQDAVSIRPIAVIDDSRCPSSVQCIQAGSVRLSLKASSGAQTGTHELLIGQSVTIGKDTVTFVSASPARTNVLPIAASSYRFTFSVKHGGSNTAPPGECHIGGCSSELCTDSEDAVSSCIYRAQYACYKTATCARQANGACGWTPSQQLSSCLANPPAIQ